MTRTQSLLAAAVRVAVPGIVAVAVLASFETRASTIVTGASTGLVYAVLAAGLVLIYRANRVVNFAHADIGGLGAAVAAKLVLDLDWGYIPAFVVAVVIGAFASFVIEVGVVRRLADRPRVVLLVATIGLAQILFVITAVTISIENASAYPQPIDRQLTVANVTVFGDGLLALAVMPALIIGIGLFLNRTPYGAAVKAASENRDAALLAGVNVRRLSTLVWVLAGAVAAASVMVAAPLRGDLPGLALPALGPTLLLRALAAALVGRFTSLPLTLAGGIGVGVAEAVLRQRFDVGTGNVIIAVAVVLLVLFRARGDRDEEGSFSIGSKFREIPDALQAIPTVRRLPRVVIGTAVAVAVALPLVVTSASRQQTFALMFIFAIVGLSVTVLTGWSGQLSLGQFGFVGVGAAGTADLAARGVPFGAAIAYATVGTTMVAVLVALPAVRVRGLYLAITTIGFAVAAHSFIVPRLVGSGAGGVVTVHRPRFGPIDFKDQRAYYYLCLAVLIGLAAMTARLRRTGIGRALIAVRDNEASAAAFSVPPARVKLLAFALSGALAAVAGGLYAGLAVQLRTNAFGPEESLRVVAMVIIGGLGSVPGAILGAVWVVGLPAIFGATAEIRALTTAPALLVLLLYLPGGLMQIATIGRDRLVALLARRAGDQPEPVERPPARIRARDDQLELPDDVPALTVAGVDVRFGGLHAVRDVHLHVAAGEIVGLIGSNGAGKSTLMNAISGQVPATGHMAVWGRTVSGLPPAERALAGVGRTFQNALLFPELTVRESISVALEAREGSELVPSALALPPSRRSESRKRGDADDLITLLGLGRYAQTPTGMLSTGTRRVCELACLLAVGTRLLLLDEPTAGVAQRETEAFGPLIDEIRGQLDASVLLIEHDMPLVMAMSDRIYCMGAGAIIAEGLPAEVRSDPAVIASYLGTDERAIARSDQLAPA